MGPDLVLRFIQGNIHVQWNAFPFLVPALLYRGTFYSCGSLAVLGKQETAGRRKRQEKIHCPSVSFSAESFGFV